MSRIGLMQELARRPLLCDGGMGTQLMARGLASGGCGMEWNVSRPQDVQAVHAAYRAAGCDLITTNSFRGSRYALALHGKAGMVDELNRAAARLARAAAGEDGWVLGDVGPSGEFLEPLGDLTADELRGAFSDQIRALLAGGADAVLIETMSDPEEVVVAIEAALTCRADVPVIATYAFQKTADGAFRTMMGTTVADAIGRALAAGATVVGANCGTALDLDDYVQLCGRVVTAAGGAPVIIQPNAGAPQIVDGATVYRATPEQMAETAARLLAAGARIVGGCCGTTPAHLAAMAAGSFRK